MNLLTTAEAATHLRMSRDELIRRANAGTIPSHQPGGPGTRRLFDPRELDAWVRGEWAPTTTRKRRARRAA